MAKGLLDLRKACDALIDERHIDRAWLKYSATEDSNGDAGSEGEIDVALPRAIARFQKENGVDATGQEISSAIDAANVASFDRTAGRYAPAILGAGVLASYATFYALIGGSILPALALAVACVPMVLSLGITGWLSHAGRRLEKAQNLTAEVQRALSSIVSQHEQSMRGASAALETSQDPALSVARCNVLWGTARAAADTVDAVRDQIADKMPDKPSVHWLTNGSEVAMFALAIGVVAFAGGIITGFGGWAAAHGAAAILASAIGMVIVGLQSHRVARGIRSYFLDIFDRPQHNKPAPAAALRSLDPTLHIARAVGARFDAQQDMPATPQPDHVIQAPGRDVHRIRLAGAPIDDPEKRLFLAR